ncbi:MAG: hypothetical protein Athens041674_487 [Parcubacteria group bacterium Athens0416_74]|nr:MAG: hypothetical protein Athens041674_487 [Parcubacteria group bacterium Athens0416_74]
MNAGIIPVRKHFWERIAEGISLASRRAVARLGLGTGSRFGLLASQRSAVRFPAASSKRQQPKRFAFGLADLGGCRESNPDRELHKLQC